MKNYKMLQKKELWQNSIIQRTRKWKHKTRKQI